MLGKKLALLLVLVALPTLAPVAQATAATPAGAVIQDANCQANVLPRNDDGSTGAVQMGFEVDFFGETFSSLYVNNNGNVTFDGRQGTYTPYGLIESERAIIAPFFADVDTRNSGSLETTYGQTTYLGRPAFCVNWVQVGYYDRHADKLNDFQLLLVSLNDGSGDFDIYFNYDRIQWETGDASGGSGGLGGFPARVGFSNGRDASYEMPGSGVSGYFLDASYDPASHSYTGLRYHSRNSSVLGRYRFQVRQGDVQYSNDLPLIIAHGITGSAEGEIPIQDTARGSVPSLVPDARVKRTETTAIGSVWTNAEIIEADARTLVHEQGVRAVNVIAHSKGGLDTRAAIFNNPGLFNTLGMISTPNGGSTGADALCALRHLPKWLGGNTQSQFGECGDEDDGLFNLQTAYVQDVFNPLVRDDVSKNYYNLASDCGGFTHYKCNGADNLLLRCKDGGDMATCVESAFWLTENYDGYDVPGGLQVALDPVFDLDHSTMNKHACPTLRLLSVMYPLTSTRNPWTDGGGPECLGAPEGLSATGASLDARVASLDSLAEPASTTEPMPMVPQTIVQGSSAPDQPFTLTLDPEGQDTMGVVVVFVGETQPMISVLDTQGNDTGATVTWLTGEESLGVPQALVLLSGLAGQQRTLQITSDTPQPLGVETLVSASTALATSVVPGPVTGSATVTATIVGASKQLNARTTITAYLTDATGATQTVPLSRNAQSGDFAATTGMPAGPFVQIGVVASGPGLQRYAMTGIALPDGQGEVGTVSGDSLMDLDADGIPDALRLPIAVNVAQAGYYTLVVDAVDASGATASASGSAELAAGAGVINVDMPLDRLITVGASGPLSLVNGLLVRGKNPQKVAIATSMGTAGSYDASSLVPTHLVVSRFASTASDTDGDGVPDTATFSGWISAPQAGQYELTARLEAPDGTYVGIIEFVGLEAGVNELSFDVSIDSTVHGIGVYRLTGIVVTGLDDVASWAFGHDASIQIGTTPSEPDLAGLVATWRQARAVGAVLSPGLRASGDARIRHIADADAAGRQGEEIAQLDVLIRALERATAADLTPDWQDQLLYQARSVRDQVAP